MIRKSNGWLGSSIAAVFFTAAVVASPTAHAQNREKYDSVAARYKNEHAVYTNYIEKLNISQDEEGHLVAKSDVVMEKLFLTDLSATNYNIDYFTHGSFHELTDFNATAYIPVSNKGYKRVENSIFGEGGSSDRSELTDDRYIVAYYTGLRKNAITTTTYSEVYPNLYLLNGFGFRENIPILNATYQVTVPKFVKMNFALVGPDTNIVKRSVWEEGSNVVYTFTAKNVKAFKGYPRVPSGRYLVPIVFPAIVSFRPTGAKKDSVLAGNKDAFYHQQYKFIKGLNIKTGSDLNKKVDELTRNAYSDREKAANIYRWVQDNLHYFGFERGLEGFVPRQADTVFARKYGDCKDMASIISAMCRKAGLNAYFTWIGTNDIPYSHDEMLDPALYNHMICAVHIGEDWIFLDGTDKHLPFGDNRIDIQGKEALVAIDANHYEIVKVPVASESRSVITDNSTMRIMNNDIAGSVSQHYTGYPSWTMIHELDGVRRKDEKDKYVRNLTMRGSDKYLCNQYDVSENDNLDISLNTDYTIGDYVNYVGKQCIINMNATRRFAGLRVNDSNRNVPVYLDNKETIRESVVLEVPKGYKVAYVPKPAEGSIPGLWAYKIAYNVDNKAGKVTLTKEYQLNTTKIDPTKFEENNKLVDELKKQYRETVVLTAQK
jgi:hypothetical protein